jgi:cysteine-rich repeat protein
VLRCSLVLSLSLGCVIEVGAPDLDHDAGLTLRADAAAADRDAAVDRDAATPPADAEVPQHRDAGEPSGHDSGADPVSFCGNGELEPGEQCDDGNRQNGDGCSSECRIEMRSDPELPGCSRVQRHRATLQCWQPRGWREAAQYCRGAGLTLASVDSAEDNELLSAAAGWGSAWIGFNDLADEGHFVWDGRPTHFTHWNRGEPNNSGDEDCTQMLRDGRWNDADCWVPQMFFCEDPSR